MWGGKGPGSALPHGGRLTNEGERHEMFQENQEILLGIISGSVQAQEASRVQHRQFVQLAEGDSGVPCQVLGEYNERAEIPSNGKGRKKVEKY